MVRVMMLPLTAHPPPGTDRYAVVGHPIAHSQSPRIHTGFALACTQSMHYSALEAPHDGFAETVDAFRASGGLGVNVTLPFKLLACKYATQVSARAARAGAANALKFEGNQCLADNFDGIGLVRDIVHNLGRPLKGQRVLILGAGGATRGALEPLLAEQPAHIRVANRTATKAHELARLFEAVVPPGTTLEGGSYADFNTPFDVVINATSASLDGQALPLEAQVFAPHALAYDMMYGQGLTPFLRLAQHAQPTQAVALADGVGMLVEQAAEAFAWWRGVRPPTREMINRIAVPLQ